MFIRILGNPVTVENGTFSWGHGEEDKPILKKINMRVKDGSLVGIVGTVGSGKSSLCSALLGEMEKDTGKVNIKVINMKWKKVTTL